MSITRKIRSYFFSSPEGEDYHLFNKKNKPNKQAFVDLFNSILFPSEQSDTATENNAGHVKMASDNDAMSRTSASASEHSKVVAPHQLPSLVKLDGTEILGAGTTEGGLGIVPLKKTVGGKQKLDYHVRVFPSKSIKIGEDESVLLDGDVDTPEDLNFYGQKGGKKGFYPIYPNLTVGYFYYDGNDFTFKPIFPNLGVGYCYYDGTSFIFKPITSMSPYVMETNQLIPVYYPDLGTGLKTLVLKGIMVSNLSQREIIRLSCHFCMEDENATHQDYVDLSVYNADGTLLFCLGKVFYNSNGGTGTHISYNAEISITEINIPLNRMTVFIKSAVTNYWDSTDNVSTTQFKYKTMDVPIPHGINDKIFFKGKMLRTNAATAEESFISNFMLETYFSQFNNKGDDDGWDTDITETA